MLLPVTASYPLANSECREKLDSRFGFQPEQRDPVARDGRGRYLGGYRCGKMVRKPPLRLSYSVPLRRKRKTPHYGDPRQAKPNPQRKWSAGHSRRRRSLGDARLATLDLKEVLKGSPHVSGLKVAEVLQLPTRHRKEIPPHSQES